MKHARIVERYIDTSTEALCRMHPEWDKKDVWVRVARIVDQRCQNPTIIVENNTKNEPKRERTLLDLCEWIEKEHPIIAGNATFYCQPDVLRSPTSLFLSELQARRAQVKKELFQYEPGSDMYVTLDLESNNIKVILNANYGASGNEAAAFYNEYQPAAVTLLAQSIITTMAAFFEGFCGDNQRFFMLNEAIDWMEKVMSKKDVKIRKWLTVPSHEELFQRILQKFESISQLEISTLRRYIFSMNERERILVYYANNLRGLIYQHSEMRELVRSIMRTLPALKAGEVPEPYKIDFNDVSSWNKHVSKAMFLNPYGVPECIRKELERFQRIIMDYVFVEYLTADSIVKLNNHERNTVLLVDTDSNGIFLGNIVKFILDDVLDGENYGRERMYDEIIVTSTLISVMSIGAKRILDYYAASHNVKPEERKVLSMKNEFLWVVFFVMHLKKHYGALVAMREGNISIPFRLDIKGMDFIKAAVSKEVSERYTRLLVDYILSQPDNPDLRGVMKEIKKFEKEIVQDLDKGGMKYLKSQTYKPFKSYGVKPNKFGEMESIAWTQQVFRGSEVWNLIEDEHKISPMDRVIIVKTVVESIEDISPMMDTDLEMYQRIRENVFHNPEPKIVKTGLSVVCIPQTLETIPKWLIPYINRDAVVSDMVSLFSSVLETFGIGTVEFKTPNAGKARRISGLISV